MDQASVVCMKLGEELINRITYVCDNTSEGEKHQVTLENAGEYIPLNTIEGYLPLDESDQREILWKKCKVGHNAFRTEVDPRFTIEVDLEKRILNGLSKLYPRDILNMSGNKTTSLKNLIMPHIASHMMDGKWHDYGDYSYHNHEENDITFLLHIKGSFSKEHSETPTGRKFATTLIVLPTKMKGGDLVLRTTMDSVYDPDKQLTQDGDRVRLKVDQITEPVLISFWVKIPHEVEEVIEGYRLCFEMSQSLNSAGLFFLNDKIFDKIINVDRTTIETKKIQNQINRLKDKMVRLQSKIEQLEIELMNLSFPPDVVPTDLVPLSDVVSTLATYEYPSHRPLLEKIKNGGDFHLVVLKTGPEEMCLDGAISTNRHYIASNKLSESLLSQFDPGEVLFVTEILRLYPYSHIKSVRADRLRIPRSRGMTDPEEVLSLCRKPGTGRLRFPCLEPETQIEYLIDPIKVSIGYRLNAFTGYYGGNYSGYDSVYVYILCVQKVPSSIV